MSWAIGWDPEWGRDIGYGVPAWCDYPGCPAKIDRGLSYVCGGQPFGGERGCGLYFCDRHLLACSSLCDRCDERMPPFDPSPDHPEWVAHKLSHPSWAAWRAQHPEEVAAMQVGRVL